MTVTVTGMRQAPRNNRVRLAEFGSAFLVTGATANSSERAVGSFTLLHIVMGVLPRRKPILGKFTENARDDRREFDLQFFRHGSVAQFDRNVRKIAPVTAKFLRNERKAFNDKRIERFTNVIS